MTNSSRNRVAQTVSLRPLSAVVISDRRQIVPGVQGLIPSTRPFPGRPTFRPQCIFMGDSGARERAAFAGLFAAARIPGIYCQ